MVNAMWGSLMCSQKVLFIRTLMMTFTINWRHRTTNNSLIFLSNMVHLCQRWTENKFYKNTCLGLSLVRIRILLKEYCFTRNCISRRLSFYRKSKNIILLYNCCSWFSEAIKCFLVFAILYVRCLNLELKTFKKYMQLITKRMMCLNRQKWKWN